jgi:hypothetical protein
MGLIGSNDEDDKNDCPLNDFQSSQGWSQTSVGG